MRIIFAGTPEFAVAPLQALIAEHDVIGVFTQPDRRAGRGKKLLPSPVKRVAEQHQIPLFQPDKIMSAATTIADLNADVMVVVAYGMLLPPHILSLPALGCINIHASLLPRWRGAAPIQRAIEAGDQKTGVAIMQMEAGLDTGPVFEMLSVQIGEHDTSASMHDKLADLGAQGIITTLAKLSENPTTTARPQDHDRATYAHKITKQEAIIDWQQSATQIHNRLRAFIPWPVSETYHADTRIRIWQAEPQTSAADGFNPGAVIATEPDILIACGEGVLKLTSLQRDGGKPLGGKEFCNGYPLAMGDCFTNKPNV